MNLDTDTDLPCLDLLFFKVDFDALKVRVTLKKRLTICLSLAGISLTKISLEENNLIIPAQGESDYSDIPAGDGEIDNLLLQCRI